MAVSVHLTLALCIAASLSTTDAVNNKAKAGNGAKLCKEEPDIIVERNLALTGYHRELQTVVHSRNRLKVKGRPPTLLVLDNVPSGAFVDAHQLRLLDDSDASFGLLAKVDVEKMEHQSDSIHVYTFLSLNESSALAALPVHMRYHRPQNCLTDGPFAKVTLPPPLIYFRHPDVDFQETCGDLQRLPCDAQNMEIACSWKQLKVPGLGALTADVPVGCLEDSFLVSVVTLVTYSLCSVAIAYFVFSQGKKHRSD